MNSKFEIMISLEVEANDIHHAYEKAYEIESELFGRYGVPISIDDIEEVEKKNLRLSKIDRIPTPSDKG